MFDQSNITGSDRSLVEAALPYCYYCRRKLILWSPNEVRNQTCPECYSYLQEFVQSPAQDELCVVKELEQLVGEPIPAIPTTTLRSIITEPQSDSITGYAVNDGQHITGLLLPKKGMMTLPHSIGKLTELEVLSLTQNELTYLPETVGDLRKLEEVGVSENMLRSLPKSFLTLPLRVLDLRYNHVSVLSGPLPKSLEILDLSYNQLDKLPTVTENNSLTQLYAEVNQIRAVTEEQLNTPNLQILVLNNNKIRHFSPEFSTLNELRILDLGKNQLTELPDVSDNLVLRELYAENNKLRNVETTLPSSLEILDLSYNKLDKLPDDFERLSNLRVVDLMWNNLHDLPDYLIDLPLLEALYVGGNPIGNQTKQKFRQLEDRGCRINWNVKLNWVSG